MRIKHLKVNLTIVLDNYERYEVHLLFGFGFTWSSRAAMKKATKSENDSPLVLLYNLKWELIQIIWYTRYITLNNIFWKSNENFIYSNSYSICIYQVFSHKKGNKMDTNLKTNTEWEWQRDHDESPRNCRKQPTTKANSVIGLIG